MTQQSNTPGTSATEPGKSAAETGKTEADRTSATVQTEQARTSGVTTAQVNATTDTAKAEASRTAETAKEEADRLKDKALDLGEQAKSAASRTADEARNYARNVAEDQKSAAADGVGDVARALEDAAEQLDGRYGFVSGYVRTAADEVDRVASSLRDRSVDDLYTSVESFARRQPTAFLGATVLAGFALARFIKSSAPEEDVYYGEPRYGLPAERRYGQTAPADADAPYAEAGVPHRAVNPPNTKPAGSSNTGSKTDSTISSQTASPAGSNPASKPASDLTSGVSASGTPAASSGTR